MKIKLFIFALLALLVTSCTGDAFPEPSKKERKTVTINVLISPETRVTYNDANLKLAWESGDQLLLAGYNGTTFIGSSIFDYDGTGNTFSGTPVGGVGTTYKAYYPAGAVTLDANGNVQPFSADFWQQTQNGNGATDHLRNKLILFDNDANAIDQPFSLALKSDIMRFKLSGMPQTIGDPKTLIWTVTTAGGGDQSVTLNIANYTHTSGAELTAFLAFDPTFMNIAANGKVKITLVGDKSYEWSTTNSGKSYTPGNRYKATVSGTWTEVVPFIYTIRTDQANTTHKIYLRSSNPPACPATLTIDWGDGSSEIIPQNTALNQNMASHPYVNAGDYTITIYSDQTNFSNVQMPQITFNRGITGENLLTAVLSPFPNMGATYFDYCFSRCSGLTSIPADLFRYNTGVTTFNRCFFDCTQLYSIPEGLFSYNTLATNFEYCFRGCSQLNSVPTDLFRYNTKVTTFYCCFSKCSQLTSIPADLFRYNTQATNFRWCFYDCIKLQLIPEIFPDPDTEPDFFAGRTMNFAECFINVASSYTTATGTAPKLWEFNGSSNWSFSKCFNNANVTNKDFIPGNWK
jgi:hypothetical protein